MGRAATKPSAAVGNFLRQRRKELGFTLKGVSARIEEMGESLHTSTLVRFEQGKLDPGLRRFHLLLKLYRVPPHLVMDLMDLEQLAIEEPTKKNLKVLYRDGIALWKKGNIGDALAHLFAIRRHVVDDEESRNLRQEATLTFAIAARDLGKIKLARQLVDDLLCEPVDPALLAHVLILASTLWSKIGCAEMSLISVRAAREHLDPGDQQREAWILHQEAKLLLAKGQPEEAQRALDRAARIYSKLGDTHGAAQVRVVRVHVLEAQGELEGALSLARKALSFALKHGHDLTALAARLELGRLLIKSGAADRGVEHLREVLAKAVRLKDRIAEFHAHYYLWKAYEALGDREAARFEFQVAISCVRFIDEPTPEAEEIRNVAEEVPVKRLARVKSA